MKEKLRRLKPYLSKLSKTENIFLLLAVPAVLLFALMTPPAWGLDEQVHIARAYQLSEGNIYPDKLPGKGNFGGDLPRNLVDALNYGHSESNSVNRAAPFFVRTDIRNPALQDKLLSQKLSGERMTYDFGPTGPYAPVVYAPASVGMFIGKSFDMTIGSTVILAKLFQAATFVALGYLALRLVARYKLRWVVFLLALFPATIFQAATVNADAVTIGASLLFFAIIIDLFLEKKKITRNKAILLIIASFLLAISKPSYALFLLVLPFLPMYLFPGRKWGYIFKGSLTLGALVILALVSLKGLQYSDTILKYRDAVTAAQISLGEQIVWTLAHPLEFLRILFETIILNTYEWQISFVGLLGYNTIAVPYPLQVLILGCLLLAIVYMERLPGRLIWILTGFGALSLLSIIFLLYGTFNQVGARPIIGVQGRYFIPCIPFIAVGIARLLPVKISMPPRSATLLFAGVSGFVLFFTMWAYATALY